MSDNNVIPIGGITRLDLPADQILENNKGQFKSVALVGWDHDGELRFCSSIADGGDLLWILEKTKKHLLE